MAPCFLYKLTAVFLCTSPAGGYVHQMIDECVYGEDISDMLFLVKNVFNQRLLNFYDSRVGKYVGIDEFGMRLAAHYNSQAWKMRLRRLQVEMVCRYNAQLFRRSTLDRKVPPVVRVRQTEPADYGERSMLECSARGFFPREVRVSWLRDGVKVDTGVSSTEVMANGDWSFQLHSYLEFVVRRGERVTCRVEHSSLQRSLDVDWDTYPLDSKHMKMTIGIICFFIGLTVAAGGAAYYRWKKRSGYSPGRQDTNSGL